MRLSVLVKIKEMVGGIMNKTKLTSDTLESILILDRQLQNKINEKEIKIKILEAEIEQLYEIINEIQHLGEIENKKLTNMEV